MEPDIIRLVVGVDEAGRGPLAGPVIAGAVIWSHQINTDGLADSKRLSAGQRETMYQHIIRVALDWAVGESSPEEIDALNIRQATLLAMQRAVEGLRLAPALALVDGRDSPALACPAITIIRGDALQPSISAASIVAKVTRDRMMHAMAQTYPGYGFEQHKGYPTARHIAALRELGPCPTHRRSFAPVRNCTADQGLG